MASEVHRIRPEALCLKAMTKPRTIAGCRKSKKLKISVGDANLMACRLLADALEKQPELQVVGCAADKEGLLSTIQSTKPDVLLIGAYLQGGALTGILALPEIHSLYPDVLIILMLDQTEPQLVIEAFRAGARGVFARSQPNINILYKCILRVSEGQVWVDNKQLLYLLDAFTGKSSESALPKTASILALTPREESVVRLVVQGMGNREIAETLRLSQHTVKNYLVRIFEKLGLSSRVELALFAMTKLEALGDTTEQRRVPSPVHLRPAANSGALTIPR